MDDEFATDSHEDEVSDDVLDEVHGGYPSYGGDGGSCTRGGGGVGPIVVGGGV